MSIWIYESNSELDILRQQIDAIDAQMQELLTQRALCAQQVAEVKLKDFEAQNGTADLSQVMFYRPEREAQVLRKVMERNKGPLDAKVVAHIFREIMSACLALEKPMEVAYFGPAGSFTHAAALKAFWSLGGCTAASHHHQCVYPS